MRILIRTSISAIWARRLGGLAVPLVVLPVLLHHLGLISSPHFLSVILVAGSVACVAVLLALLALVSLWYSGDQGWGRALAGLLLGFVCLVPFGWHGYLAWRYPPVTDMATLTDRGAMPLIFAPDTFHTPRPILLSPAEQQVLFPNATTRRYPLDTAQMLVVIERLVRDRGWDIRQTTVPTADAPMGRLNARITTLGGWREEVVFRIQPYEQGSVVDMRSASINAPHDFGGNGNRIAEFMVALDTEVTTLLRDNPNVTEPTLPDEPAPAVDTEPGG